MVMETPSPQCVGREFVRQYYTLLHEAPLHLHRFYSHNSSFVHGGVEKPGEEQPPVMGQADIHKKIMSLNFRDCHAKIRQVDSQATVGNAVVVQVTGELSNNGQPMRRFMQTFVLAPQSPKKYYVHNDIFRYQDEVFNDDSDMENQDEEDSDVENVDSTSSVPETVQDTSVPPYYEQQPSLSNGTAHLEERVDSPSQKSMEEEKEELEQEEPYEEKVAMEEPNVVEPEPEMVEEEPQNVSESKPFSWAALAGKNANAGVSQPTAPQANPMMPQSFGKPNQVNQMSRSEPKPDIGQQTGGPPQPQRGPRPPRDRVRDRERTSMSRDEGDNDSQSGRRVPGPSLPSSRFPDSHQLFVGNLPHNVSEKDLKDFFEKFGSVVELRINTKGTGGKLPNFGFVVFDSETPVQDILRQKPIKFNGDHRLNVEEKKPRGENRPGSGRGGPPRGGMRGGMGMGSGMGMGRGGMGGRGGGMGRPERGSMGGGGRGGMGATRR